jgi:hypothetical protein
MTEDNTTTTLYLSSLLPIQYPMFWNGFKQALEQNNIKYLFLEGTKDIRVRDYMPVQVTSDKFVQFHPDYSKMDSSLHDEFTAQEDVISQTGLRPERFYNHLPDNQEFTNQEAVKIGMSMGVTDRTVVNYLKKLKEKGFLEQAMEYGPYKKS